MRKYNVVILGPRGSGKTVYLGCLYHKLSTPSAAGYFLKAELEQQKKLNKIYTTLLVDWPKATEMAQTDVWDFDVMVKSQAGQNHRSASIRYYDYSGGRLTDVIEDRELAAETKAIFESADVLLGLIDGQRLYNHLAGKHDDSSFWTEDVKGICDLMTQHSGKAVHFLVSKWDLFEDSDDSVSQVRKALLNFEPFKNLIASRVALTRLIPVSSVGRDFAKIRNGTAAKQNGTLPSPIHVEVPFACILPDLIETELKKAIAANEQRAKELEREVQPNLSWWEVLTGWLGNVVYRALENRGIHAPVLKWMADRARRSANTKILQAAEIRAQNQEEANRLRRDVNNEETAIQFVVCSMSNTVSELDIAYPSSKLTP